ncbi:unnamed protein product [Kluyveromyces dobzhanskii CBS 2104]|uniref:WGS project CCBQ000000000 data, contig 00105 n=1 Tax=Kluyveromyces dobzhanskii CBS 2104 TaxID=1427455 RepID=A0A0A8L1C4_9SACH|nr:unnamed protein product [Kluyveromyces dobzhanskii CBS 2104]
MNIFDGSDEEDNNPFSGTTHLYASGIAAVTDGPDDYDFTEPFNNSEINENSGKNLSHEPIQEIDEPAEEIDDDSLQTWKFASTELSRTSAFDTSYTKIADQGAKFEAIRIVDAGQYRDIYGKYAIGYKIEFGGIKVTRRYSEFDTLRQSLCRLLPTIIIPPIPSKHPIIKYLFNPLHAKKDIRTIERRQRLLSRFLNNCHKVKEIRDHVVFQKFLNPEYYWKEVLNSPPISILPMNNLLAPPLNPTKPSPIHLLLPTPASLTMRRHEELMESNDESELRFFEHDSCLLKYKEILQPLNKTGRNIRSNVQTYSAVLSELGAYFNAFSLENSVFQVHTLLEQVNRLSIGIEKTGQAIDVNYVSAEMFSETIMTALEERSKEMLQFIQEAQRVLRFRNFKQEQYYTVEATIEKRKDRITQLKEADKQASRLEEALKLNAEESPTVAQAMESITKSPSNRKLTEEPKLGTFRSPSSRNGRSTSDSLASDVEPHLLTQDERVFQVKKLEKEIEKLNECFKLIEKDLKQVNESMDNSLNNLETYFHDSWYTILHELAHNVVSWLKDCSESWKNAKQSISSI